MNLNIRRVFGCSFFFLSGVEISTAFDALSNSYFSVALHLISSLVLYLFACRVVGNVR